MSAAATLDLPPQLLLLRHGKSSWGPPQRADFDRPLAARGKRDAPRMGRWILDRDLVPDFIVSSPARRARQTARRATRAMGLAPDRVQFDERIYEASVSALLEVIGDRPDGAQRMLLVGHNPGLELLVRRIAATAPEALDAGGAKLFPAAALAHIRAGALVEIARPRSLETPAELE